jgi:lysophospholipase L1-like esterase
MITVLIFTVVIIAAAIALFLYFQRYILTNENPDIWEKRVKKIESMYHDNYPQNTILFVGSSSIDYWKTLEKDMEPLKVLNHGIAGTKIADITYYAERLIFPFKPSAIVLYAGTNDINGIKSNSKTGDDVSRLTINFFNKVHEKLPDLPIYYISISPTKARAKVWKDAVIANQLIKEYCIKYENLTFIDATDLLLDSNGRPKANIFRLDRLHFNKNGYIIWSSAIKPVLQKYLRFESE